MVCLKNLMLLLIMEPMRDPLNEAMVNMFNIASRLGPTANADSFLPVALAVKIKKGPLMS